jgi:hypothetical protein
MSTSKMRESGNARLPSRSKTPSQSRLPRYGKPRGGPRSGKSSRVDRIWGFTPNSEVSSTGLSVLFSEQNRLKAALLRQSRLAKLDVTEMRSTEAEHLRMVNQAILDVSSGVPGAINPFAHRDLTDAQILSESIVSRQGCKRIGGTPIAPRALPGTNAIRIRSKRVVVADRSYDLPTLEELLTLRGPLARTFRRAVERGYRGSPSQWLRSPAAAREILKLQQKGFTFPPTGLSVMQPNGPLFFAVNGCSGIEPHSLSYGFRRETIRRKAVNLTVLRCQAASVPRLKRHEWPLSGHAWPTYPTLNESWAAMVTGKFPLHLNKAATSETFLRSKRPTKQVKPGTSERVLSYYVIGIRADIEVPRTLLGYFKYRWGFLILRRHCSFNRNLTKFLSRLWKTDHTGMFLREPIRYNDALRCIPPSKLCLLGGFVRGGDLPPSFKKSKVRRRPPRRTRLLAKAIESGSPKVSLGLPPYSDKSDDGVRLC